jgi:menaquinone-specific isochorismate synthase
MPASPVTGMRLVASTVPLDSAVDLVDVTGGQGYLWERPDGVSLAGWGVAARVPVQLGRGEAGDVVGAALGAIEVDGSRPPVAVGALPFSPSDQAHLVVPAVLVRREADGSHWLTVTAADPRRALDDVRRRLGSVRAEATGPGPGEYRISSVMERGAWCGLVDGAARTVAAGRLSKVVLAREVVVVADQALRPADVVRRLRLSHPSCMVFSVDGFVGASPELLVERRGEHVRSHPLAGTAARSGPGEPGDGHSAWLLSSGKERHEHRLVVEAVAAALAPLCDELHVPPVPDVVPIGTLAHLGTSVTGRLRRPLPTAMELADAIHPSPAVAGTPTGAALDYIAAVERLDRGRYAGPVGWVDGDGDGCWAIGIRSAEIDGCRARLMAGVGIVEGSDPDAELAETDLKLQPLLAAIVRP